MFGIGEPTTPGRPQAFSLSRKTTAASPLVSEWSVAGKFGHSTRPIIFRISTFTFRSLGVGPARRCAPSTQGSWRTLVCCLVSRGRNFARTSIRQRSSLPCVERLTNGAGILGNLDGTLLPRNRFLRGRVSGPDPSWDQQVGSVGSPHVICVAGEPSPSN